jgi:hypothetical protein
MISGMGTRELNDWDEISRATDEFLRPERMFEASCDFLRGWEVLWAKHNSDAVKKTGERSPISACAMCASMALELALKSLITLENREPLLSHSFARLFKQLSPRSRSEVASKVVLDGKPTSAEGVAVALKLCAGTLNKWRYRHEHSDIDFRQGHMMSVTRAVHEVVSQRLSIWHKQLHPLRTRPLASFAEKDARELVSRAVERLRSEDEDLPDDVNERSLSHRLAVHLEHEVRRIDPRLLGAGFTLQDLSVDCEYNRYGGDPKRLHPVAEGIRAEAGENFDWTADTKGRTVYPDIVVHRRGTAGPNLIVIEVSRADAAAEAIGWDKDKLDHLQRELGYLHAFLVLFGRGTPKILLASTNTKERCERHP